MRLMRIIIDSVQKVLRVDQPEAGFEVGLYSKQAFEVLTRYWLKVGWGLGYPFSFTWMGRPIIQLPEDVLRIQEVIYRLRPDVIIETGVAFGGSMLYYASLLRSMERGRVIGVDLEIRPENRAAIEGHALGSSITLVEGDSTSDAVVSRIRALVEPGETVLVLLDSNHSKAHVAAELEQYHRFVSPGSYIVVTDGINADLADVPHGHPDWAWDNPSAAAAEFAASHPEFVLDREATVFGRASVADGVTYWPGGWLRRLR
jgi:cephalosporin hydroxylase